MNGRDIHKTLEDANPFLRPAIKTFEANSNLGRHEEEEADWRIQERSNYRPKGKPIEVDAHNFEDKELGKVVPYQVIRRPPHSDPRPISKRAPSFTPHVPSLGGSGR